MSIHLNQNTANQVIFTGTEKATLTSPYWLFIFKNRQTKSSIRCVATNQSTATTRYDKVTIIETGSTANYTASTPYLSLSPGGQFDYYIYEQASSSNLNPNNATSLVEQGIMQLSGYSQTAKFYFTGNTSDSQANSVFVW